MRRCSTLVAVLGLLAAAGCAAREPGESPRDPETHAHAVVSQAEEVQAAERRHAALLREWQERGVRFDRRSWRMTQIQVVFANLGAVAHRPELPWQVHFVEDAGVDAAAAGGGYVYVHDGLFGHTGLVSEDDDDALAALLAHAIAHTALVHAPLGGTSFSAEQEKAADRLAVLYMALAGYDPRAALRVWQRAAARAPARFLAAHPLDAERAGAVSSAVAQVLPYYVPGRLNPRWESIHAEHSPSTSASPQPAASGSRLARALTAPPASAVPAPASAPAPVPAAPEPVSSNGYAGVRIGMSVAEASTTFGSPLLYGDGSQPVPVGDAGCYYVSPAGIRAFAFMVVDGRVARVDIDEPGPETAEGVGVGSSEVYVRNVYAGRVETSPHADAGAESRSLTVQPDAGHALVFETDGARVTRYRAGRLPAVSWSEGCP